MTVATNALLEGRGARTALVATEGFTDLIALGRQTRAELYRLCAARPAPLVPDELRFGAPERMTPGRPATRARRPTPPTSSAQQVAEADVRGGRGGAAALLPPPGARARHSARRSPEALPDAHVSLSHEVVGTFREYERAATTEIDAALSPLLASYLRRLVDSAREADLPEPAIMQSNGGLIDLEAAAGHAAWTVLSGPAGGAAGAAFVARAAGAPDALCFDMGGTSCDVCVVDDGAVQERSSGRDRGAAAGAADARDPHRGRGRRLDRLARRRRRAAGRPALGGRRPRTGLLRTRRHRADRHRRQPRARAACRPTRRWPAASSSTSTRPSRRSASWPTSSGSTLEACAEGIRRVAGAEMVRALRVVTVQRGIDPRRYALLPFGGAGPLHAAQIADELGIDEDRVPARVGRARGARPGRLARAAATSSEACCWPATSSPPTRSQRHVSRARASAPAKRSATPRQTVQRRPTSCATAARRSSWRSPAPADAAARASCARRSRPSTRSATATATPSRSSSWSRSG